MCICWLLTASLPSAEAAAPRQFDFNLPAERLELALQRFSAQCGASAGMVGAIPDIETRPVSGRFTAMEALQRMLAGTGIEVRAKGSVSFRLRRERSTSSAGGDGTAGELSEILVTATKRSQPLSDLPLPVTVIGADQIASVSPLSGMRAALNFDATTSSTNLGPARDRQFIRGVADSPFLGPSQATVSIQFDEARLNYSAPDPDLRLLDVDRVEVLKGPQGPLYGTGALGGVLHILPMRPELSVRTVQASAFFGTTEDGGNSGGTSGILNLPLVEDKLGLRAVGYVEHQGGWIENLDGRDNANSTRLTGGRLALRAQSAGWLFDLEGISQHQRVDDSQYVLGDANTLSRTGVLPEPRDHDLHMISGVLHRPLGDGELVISSSYVRHEVNGILDASAAAPLLQTSPPIRYYDNRSYHLLGNEVRYSSASGQDITWLLGVSHQISSNHIAGQFDPAPAAASGITGQDLRQHNTDIAVFGEAGIVLPRSLRLPTGLRLSRDSDEDETRETQNPSFGASIVHTATPSVSLDWRSADRHSLAYLRFAQAVRPGGLNPGSINSAPQRFSADRLTSVDTGLRWRAADNSLAAQMAMFVTRWRHVQSDYLQKNDLIGTQNVGDASNYGVEAQVRLTPLGGWSWEMGAVLQRARLDHPTIAVAREDPRMPVVPDIRVYALQAREFALGGWQMRAQLRADFSGRSRLSFDPELDRRTPAAFELSAAAMLRRGEWQLQLNASNLLNSHTDTFALGNQFSVLSASQYTPRQPRTLVLQLSRSW